MLPGCLGFALLLQQLGFRLRLRLRSGLRVHPGIDPGVLVLVHERSASTTVMVILPVL